MKYWMDLKTINEIKGTNILIYSKYLLNEYYKIKNDLLKNDIDIPKNRICEKYNN